MKLFRALLFVICLFGVTGVFAQTDTSKVGNNVPARYTHRDSVYMVRLNTTGNLMLAGGVGLCGVGSYLIYAGTKIYKTVAAPNSTDPSGDVHRNHSQGSAYLAGGVISIGAGVALLAFGVKDKLEFKRRLKKMQLTSGLLPNGNLGATLTF